MIMHDGWYMVHVPVGKYSYWQDRLRMQQWCVHNIGPGDSGLWNNNWHGWQFRNLEHAIMFTMTWS